MTTTNLVNLKSNLETYVNAAISFNDTINISTQTGSAVIISEQEYRNLVETMYLNSNPVVRNELLEGLETPFEECEKLEW